MHESQIALNDSEKWREEKEEGPGQVKGIQQEEEEKGDMKNWKRLDEKQK